MKVICLELWHHALGPFPAGRGQRSQSGTTKTQIGGLGAANGPAVDFRLGTKATPSLAWVPPNTILLLECPVVGTAVRRMHRT